MEKKIREKFPNECVGEKGGFLKKNILFGQGVCIEGVAF